ncbi:hypothetical protein D9M68_937560 [compost metagenome]
MYWLVIGFETNGRGADWAMAGPWVRLSAASTDKPSVRRRRVGRWWFMELQWVGRFCAGARHPVNTQAAFGYRTAGARLEAAGGRQVWDNPGP